MSASPSPSEHLPVPSSSERPPAAALDEEEVPTWEEVPELAASSEDVCPVCGHLLGGAHRFIQSH